MTEAQVAQHRAKEYETIYILRPDVAKDAAEKVSGRVEEVVAKEGGTLTQVETWGRRQLAYPVRKFKRGVYVYLKFLGGGVVVSELERNLRMLDDVLKYQTVLSRDDIEPGSVQVDPDAVKFEAIEPPTEDEADETLEQELGLVDGPDHHGRDRDRDRDRGDDGDGDGDSEEASDDDSDSGEDEE